MSCLITCMRAGGQPLAVNTDLMTSQTYLKSILLRKTSSNYTFIKSPPLAEKVLVTFSTPHILSPSSEFKVKTSSSTKFQSNSTSMSETGSARSCSTACHPIWLTLSHTRSSRLPIHPAFVHQNRKERWIPSPHHRFLDAAVSLALLYMKRKRNTRRTRAGEPIGQGEGDDPKLLRETS